MAPLLLFAAATVLGLPTPIVVSLAILLVIVLVAVLTGNGSVLVERISNEPAMMISLILSIAAVTGLQADEKSVAAVVGVVATLLGSGLIVRQQVTPTRKVPPGR